MIFDFFTKNKMKRPMKSCRRQHEAEQVTMKKKEVDHIAPLPDDLLLEILKKLQPDILRYKVRFVSRKWFILITKRILLDHASLILEELTESNTIRLMDITEEEEEQQGLKTKEQYINIPYNGRIISWCNEYLLITNQKKGGRLYIYNLLTKHGTILPPCSTSCGGHNGCKCGVGLSYDESKGVYKVVHVFVGPPIQSELLVFKSNVLRCISKWKTISGPFYMGQRKYYWDDPVSVRGRYFHWDVHCSKFLVSMDTVEERFCQTGLPGSDDYPMDNRYSLVDMSGFLALLHKTTFEEFNIWMLKDFQTAKWEKFWSISVSSFVSLSVYPGSIVPSLVTSVRNRRFIIFRKPGLEPGLYSYDLKEKITKKLDIDIEGGERCVVQSRAITSFS